MSSSNNNNTSNSPKPKKASVKKKTTKKKVPPKQQDELDDVIDLKSQRETLGNSFFPDSAEAWNETNTNNRRASVMLTTSSSSLNLMSQMFHGEFEKVVEIRVIASILEIDDVKNQFRVDFELYMHWTSDSLRKAAAKQQSKKSKLAKLNDSAAEADALRAKPMKKPSWTPTIHFFRAVEEELTQSTFTGIPETGDIYAMYNWNVTLRETLELQRFPFDRQFLTMKFYSPNAELKVWEEPPPSFMPLDHRVSVYSSMGTWRLMGTCPLSFETSPGECVCQFNCRLERRTDYYFWNIVAIVFLMVLMSFSSLVLDHELVGDRQSINITLILTAVAYKFILSQLLPAISYLTLLDIYMLTAFFILALAVLENTLVSVLVNQDESDAATRLDEIYGGIFGGGWVLFHIVALIMGYFGHFRQDWKAVQDNDNAFEEEATDDNMTLENKN